MSGRWLTRFDPRRPAFDRITLACGVVLLVGTLVLSVAEQRASLIGRADAWTVAGPPCPRVSAESARTFAAPSETFRFQGVRFVRAYGYAVCGEITADRRWGFGQRAPVCRFNSPGKLEISTARGDFHFITGIAPATVVIADDGPRCVLAAKLAPDWRRE
jgi:hypothetical protein